MDTTRKVILTDLADQNLKKHVAAIHISNRLTLTQRKASNVLLHNAYDSLLTARVHRIRVKDLAEAIGFNTHNLEPLKEALKTLARTVLEWNILDENGWQEEWGATTLLAQAVIRNGYCVYAYSPELCEKLYRPEIYALLNLSIQRKFSSSYALALYENCLRYRRVGTTGWIGIDILKRLLGISYSESYYQDFRKFNDKVIKPAVRQVNGTSDLLIEVDYQRERRKVSAIRFRVSDNPQVILFTKHEAVVSVVGDTSDIIDNDSVANVSSERLLDRQHALRKRLSAFGLSSRQIRIAISTYELSYLEGNMAVVEHDLDAGKVHNLPAYLLAALREDYRPRDMSTTGFYSTSSSSKTASGQSRQILCEERLRIKFTAMCLQKALDRLTITERCELESDYISTLESRNSFEAQLILGLYRKSGLKSRIVDSHFRTFACTRLVRELDEDEFASYISVSGYIA